MFRRIDFFYQTCIVQYQVFCTHFHIFLPFFFVLLQRLLGKCIAFLIHQVQGDIEAGIWHGDDLVGTLYAKASQVRRDGFQRFIRVAVVLEKPIRQLLLVVGNKGIDVC